MDKVLDYIRKNKMINQGEKIIVGVSGGPDSVCLLFLLKKYVKLLDITLAVVHMEHGIRGKESLKDALFVENLCETWNIPFYLYRRNVPELAGKWKCSEEEAGRRVRYEAFEEVREQIGADRIAVAHNQDDQAETVLFHLVRGSGLSGLTGIRPVRGRIIRPLLCLSRGEIETLLEREGLTFRTDATNGETDYTRNRIRLNILPLLREELNPKAAVHMAQAAERLASVESYLTDQAERELEQLSHEKNGIFYLDRRGLLQEPEALIGYILRQSLERIAGNRGDESVRNTAGMPDSPLRDLGAVHIEDLKSLAGRQSGRSLDLPGGIFARTEGAYLLLGRKCAAIAGLPSGHVNAAAPLSECAAIADLPHEYAGFRPLSDSAIAHTLAHTVPAACPLRIPGETQYGKYRIFAALEPWKNEIIPENRYTKWFDYDTIKNTVQLRSRVGGDYLTVNAAGNRKTLKKYLIDEKVPSGERDQLCLLADGAHILWVVGFRISEAYKVTEKTKQVLKVQVMEV